METYALERATCPPVEAAQAEHCKPCGVLEISQSLVVAPWGIRRAAAMELPALSSFCSWLFPFLFLSPSQPTCLLLPMLLPPSPPSSGASTHHEHPLPHGFQSPPGLKAAWAALHCPGLVQGLWDPDSTKCFIGRNTFLLFSPLKIEKANLKQL